MPTVRGVAERRSRAGRAADGILLPGLSHLHGCFGSGFVSGMIPAALCSGGLVDVTSRGQA